MTGLAVAGLVLTAAGATYSAVSSYQQGKAQQRELEAQAEAQAEVQVEVQVADSKSDTNFNQTLAIIKIRPRCLTHASGVNNL